MRPSKAGQSASIEWLRALRRRASVVQDDVEEGTVDAQVAIVVDEAQLSELMSLLCQSGPATTAPAPAAFHSN
jgi:hypothetical protein